MPARLPEKLMDMLTYVEEVVVPTLENPEDACVGWMPDGDAFVIRNEKEFTVTLLPKFFKQKTMSNFVRNLYRWGFHQTRQRAKKKGDRPAVYGHETFRRGQKDCLEMMTSDAGFRRAAQLKSAVPVERCPKFNSLSGAPTNSQEAERNVHVEQPSTKVASSPQNIPDLGQQDAASWSYANLASVPDTTSSALASFGMKDDNSNQLSQISQIIQGASAQQQLMNNVIISDLRARQLLVSVKQQEQQLQQQEQQLQQQQQQQRQQVFLKNQFNLNVV